MKQLTPLSIILFWFFLSTSSTASGKIFILNNATVKTIVFGNSKLSFTINYDQKCAVTNLVVNGEPVISGNEGIISGIRTSTASYTTGTLAASPEIEAGNNIVTIRNITYGFNSFFIRETWKFTITEADIRLDIERMVPGSIKVEEVSFPAMNFNSFKTWDGAFLGYGGLAWFYLFNEKLCTYGVHTGYAAFWNGSSGNGLKVTSASPGKQLTSKFTRTEDDKLKYSVSVSDNEMQYRYDGDTKRRRFIRQKTDVWDSFTLPAGNFEESLTFSWLNYNDEYNRGNLAGINGKQLTSLLNTIARIGVIDAKHFGGNSWHTPYGPICLHEQYIAQMGIAINDSNYLEGYKQCLDYYRDKTIQPDGRVLPRWAYDNSDAMPGTAIPEGFYEAQWGYLFDSNPDFVTNVSELYNQCGDLDWVKKQKTACEKSLDYLLRRDSNGNHLVEMMTGDHSERRGSDWIDIIWASYENAFVNAKLFYALTLWSAIEKQLGDAEKAGYYSSYAYELKKSFNKSTLEGGFWDEKNKWYVHWLDKDKSVHGNNLVVPVNFMAIAYGICDDYTKRTAILDKVEEQMQKEDLFAWPICMFTYDKGEGNDWQFPFPNYENGDIFLSWGAVGVQAYASYNPDLALKYIENILARYDKDGLAFQRYGRLKQDGLGDDILSGNSLAIVGLYKSIYGINPMYNRLYLDPHLPGKLAGTELNYNFRGNQLKISLDRDRYSVSNTRFKVTSALSFGFNAVKNEFEFFDTNRDTYNLKVQYGGDLSVEIISSNQTEFRWKQISSGKNDDIIYSAGNLKPDTQYIIILDGRIRKTIKSNYQGRLVFSEKAGNIKSEICIKML